MDVVSVVYGRFRRPTIFLAKLQGEALCVRQILPQGQVESFSLLSLHEFMVRLEVSLIQVGQPSEYLLERNILAEPNWLVDTVGGCFEHVEPGLSFPKAASLAAEARLRAMLEERGFHSPSMGEDDILLCILYIFESLDLLRVLEVDVEIFKEFLLVLRKNYKANPYHNFWHAVDVLQFTYLLLRSTPEFLQSLSHIEVFSLLLASIGHDVGHTSYNNRFHCATESLLSVLFNDQAVLENFHSLIIFAILRHPRYNFCAHWTSERWTLLRKVVISCVLGTDMAAHFKYIKRFSEAQLSEGRQLDQDSRILLAVLVIKCADISNIIRPFPVARQWGFKLVSEFFCQGDWERFLGQRPCFLTDRFTFDLARSQEHFMLQVAGPLFRLAAETFPGTSFCIESLEANVQHWRNWVPEKDEIVQASEDFRPYIRTKASP